MAKRGVGGGAGGGPRTSTQPLVSWATAVPTKEAARRRERMLTPQNEEVLARGHERSSVTRIPAAIPAGLRLRRLQFGVELQSGACHRTGLLSYESIDR